MSHYSAFISYKHVASTRFAENLELAIKRYAKPPWRLPMAIFRDEKYLEIGEDLSAAIKTALDNSDFLIYLASPEAVKSEWVQDELTQWCADKERINNLIIVLTDGTIEFDKNAAKIDWESTSALPSNLVEFIITDPLIVDLSWAKEDIQQSLLNPDYKKIVNQIAAKIRGVPPIEMSDIAIKEYRKGVRWRNGFMTAVITLAIGLAVAAGVAWNQMQIAEENSRRSMARRLGAEAELTIDQKGALIDRAVLLALTSTQLTPSAQGNAALRHSLALLPERVANLQGDSDQMRVVFSPDGRLLLTISRSTDEGPDTTEDHKINLIDVASGKLLTQLIHGARVTRVMFDSMGRYIISASESGEVKVWSVATQKQMSHFDHGASVYGLAVSPGGNMVASAGLDEGVSVWNIATGELLYHFSVAHEFDIKKAQMVEFAGEWVYKIPRPGNFSVLRFSPDGRRLAATGGLVMNTEQDIFVWDLKSAQTLIRVNHLEPVRTTPVNIQHRSLNDSIKDYINDLAFSPDGNTLASAGYDGSVRLWSVPDGKLLRFMLHDDSVNTLDFSGTGKFLVSASNDQSARIWEVESGRELYRLEHEHTVNKALFGPGDQLIATASHDHSARLWHVTDGTEFARVGHNNVVNDLDIDSTGQYWATASQDGDASIWDLNSLAKIYQNQTQVSKIKVTPDRKYYATIDDARSASVWQAVNGKRVSQLPHPDYIRDLAISANGEFLATRTAREENLIRVWQLSTGKVIAKMSSADAIGRGIALSHDGQYLSVTSGGGQTKLWSIANNKLLHTFKHKGRAIDQVFSADGQYLAVATVGPGHSALVWDVKTGVLVAKVDHKGSVYRLAFSQDGQRLATASADNSAIVWSLPTGKAILRVEHQQPVRVLYLSSDGRYLATGSEDGTAQVWDIEKKCKRILQVKLDDEIHAVALDPSNQYLATGSNDFTTRVWKLGDGTEKVRINHPKGVANVMFDTSGDYLISETKGHEVVRWLWSDIMLAEAACAKIRIGLSDEDKRQFMLGKDWIGCRR